MVTVATAIVIKRLRVVLGGRFTALEDVSVSLSAGRIIGFIGPSGAGKTTLIRAIVGRQRIAAGSITVLGKSAGTLALRRTLSYMTQAVSIYADLTVEQNLHYFAAMAGVPRREVSDAVATTLRTVGLKGQTGQLGASLSGGQKQRVSLGIALLGHPKLLVLDEPTVGLDPVLREEIWSLFRRLADGGVTIVVTSHVMDEAARCDDLLLIRAGRLLAHGSPAELCRTTQAASVEQAFLRLVVESEAEAAA